MPSNKHEHTNLLKKHGTSNSERANNKSITGNDNRPKRSKDQVINENENLKVQILQLQLEVERLQQQQQQSTAKSKKKKKKKEMEKQEENASLREVARRMGRGSNHKGWSNTIQRVPSCEERDDEDDNESTEDKNTTHDKTISQPTMNLVPHQVQRQEVQSPSPTTGIHRRHHSPRHTGLPMKDVTEEEISSIAIELPDLLNDNNSSKNTKTVRTSPSSSPKSKSRQKLKKYLLQRKLSDSDAIHIKEKLSDDGDFSFDDNASSDEDGVNDYFYNDYEDDLENHDDEEALMVESREEFMRLLWDRSSWLVGLMILQSCSSFILKNNEAMLQKHAVIVQFLTMLVGAGGNAGNQASVRVIRGLAVGALNSRTLKPFLRCEMKMALCLSFILGFTGCIRALLFLTPIQETFAITISLFIIVLTSIVIGVFLPLGMKKCHIDPAHSSTTIQVLMDILGVALTVHISGAVLASALNQFGTKTSD